MTEKILKILRRFTTEAKSFRLNQRMAVVEALTLYPDTHTMPHVDGRLDSLVTLIFELYGLDLHWQPEDLVPAHDVPAHDVPARTTSTTTTTQKENKKEKECSSSCPPTPYPVSSTPVDCPSSVSSDRVACPSTQVTPSPCTIDQLTTYFATHGEQNARAEAQACWKYNDMRGWQISGKPIKDWHWVAQQWIKQQARHPRVAPAQLTEEDMARNRRQLQEQQQRDAKAAHLQSLWNAVRNDICQVFPGEEYMNIFHPLRPLSFEDGTLTLLVPDLPTCLTPNTHTLLATTGKYLEPFRQAVHRHFTGLNTLRVKKLPSTPRR